MKKIIGDKDNLTKNLSGVFLHVEVKIYMTTPNNSYVMDTLMEPGTYILVIQ